MSLLFSDRLKRVADSIENIFSKSPSRAYSHHTFRVANYAARIAAAEGIDVESSVAAALVHDVGMVIDPSFAGHVVQTARIAPLLLVDAGFSAEESQSIAKVAASHHPAPTTTLSEVPERVLFDADCLEIVGVFGFLRWFGAIPANLKELSEAANLFIEVVESGQRTRREFFYTSTARLLGSTHLLESVLLCKSLLAFVSDAECAAPDLHPVSFRQVLEDTVRR